MLLLLAGSMTGYAQSNCFEYEDQDETIITGLTETGLAKTSLVIPKEVTKVKSGAFSSSSAKVSELIIEAGGNPTFENSLFDDRENPLVDIQILGSSMTVASISALFASLGAQGALSTVYIAGYSGEWSDIVNTSVLTSDVTVALPAALVNDQQFGTAKVCGRFEITKEIITFCGNATFQDTDDGSNMLFYVADYKAEDGRLHIQRVKNIAKGEGVLIHNATGSSYYADLERIRPDKYTGTDESLYASNMLVGVTEPMTIGRTDGDKTNYVLKNGAFHPTSGGTIGANKAYLQVPTATAREGVLTIDFDDEATEIRPTPSPSLNGGEWYDLQGRRVGSAEANTCVPSVASEQSSSTSLFTLHSSLKKGLYIKNGKKYVIR